MARRFGGCHHASICSTICEQKVKLTFGKKVLKKEESEDVTSLLPEQNEEDFAKKCFQLKKRSTAIMAENFRKDERPISPKTNGSILNPATIGRANFVSWILG